VTQSGHTPVWRATVLPSTNWKDIAELLGIAAIVASLIFVGVQLRQEQLIARTEMASVSAEIKLQINDKISEPEVAAAYAKMLSAPDELSVVEKIHLHGLLWMVIEAFKRDCFIKDRGIFEECDEQIQSLTPFYFGNEFSQRWWQLNKQDTIYALPAWVDDHISGLDKDLTLRLLDEKSASQ